MLQTTRQRLARAFLCAMGRQQTNWVCLLVLFYTVALGSPALALILISAHSCTSDEKSSRETSFDPTVLHPMTLRWAPFSMWCMFWNGTFLRSSVFIQRPPSSDCNSVANQVCCAAHSCPHCFVESLYNWKVWRFSVGALQQYLALVIRGQAGAICASHSTWGLHGPFEDQGT